ncbi:MAG: APC family permease [Firmicutes bacterium]|nr:APC family permease [Bacillota bacterium]MCL5039153.1 APC family permease [Bacillota bacterium]
MLQTLKNVLIGQPLRTSQLAHERLTNLKALAVFSSDALSSVAYATEEILLALALAGPAALGYSLTIAFFIAILLVIVALSYRQTIFAYPSGGGAYIVAKENLGTNYGLVAGAALLVDYVLTVAVSIAAGVAAITSAFPILHPYTELLALLAIAFITIANLRGVRESGSIFAAPTYLFVGSMFILIAVGLGRWLFFGGLTQAPSANQDLPVLGGLTLFLLLRAFASGCAALTGVEAISNGIQAFKEPVSPNAAKTLTWMAGILVSMFLGITILAHVTSVHPSGSETVISQIARTVFGTGPLYYLIQAATAMILLLAANTSYADFPRLASLVAKDGFLPRQLANRGDKLVFANGIILLGMLSSLLIVIYRGETHALIPLYAVGVFLSFTLSQSGMVRHWLRGKHSHRFLHVLINGLGAASTGIVLVVIAATKFIHGAWIVVLLIPLLVWLFWVVKRHYIDIADELRLPVTEKPKSIKHTIIVPVAGVNQAVAQTISYAKCLAADVRAVHISVEPEQTEKLKAKWQAWDPGIPLIVIKSPYRSVLNPLLHYIDRIERREGDDVVTVMLAEFVPRRWWQLALHNQSALLLKAALHFRPHTVVVSVPYHLKH